MSTSTFQYPPGPTTPRRRVFQEQDFRVHTATSQVRDFDTTDLINKPAGFFHNLFKAILATALFRCWHFIVFFTIEAFIITYIHKHHVHSLSIQNTLMNVLGTVLGFVLSYRSSSGFDRYNEGRKYWSQVVYNIRMFSRTVWFSVPDEPQGTAQLGAAKSVSEYKARTLVEKKTVLNLLLAYAVSLKHYLRGEEGAHYEDLYHLIKFLPAYGLPTGYEIQSLPGKNKEYDLAKLQSSTKSSSDNNTLPLPATDSNLRNRKTTQVGGVEDKNVIYLAPARNPPPYHIFDFWPMSLFVKSLQKRGRKISGRKALRDRARNGTDGNVPLDISLYLSSYIASMPKRGTDGGSCGIMSSNLGQMVDALTGLERILQTPIPFSYAVHLWTVTLIWLSLLPFQILEPLGWLAVPGVALAAFVYCGLMKSAEELENPFGYDYNDLNLDHFVHNIIRKELQALTSLPMPDPDTWAFSPDNDAVFDKDGNAIYLYSTSEERDIAPPNEWVERGEKDIRAALRYGSDNESTTLSTTTLVPAAMRSFTSVPASSDFKPPASLPNMFTSPVRAPVPLPAPTPVAAPAPAPAYTRIPPPVAIPAPAPAPVATPKPEAAPAPVVAPAPTPAPVVKPVEVTLPPRAPSPEPAVEKKLEVETVPVRPSTAPEASTKTTEVNSSSSEWKETSTTTTTVTSSSASTVEASSSTSAGNWETVELLSPTRASRFVHVPARVNTYARSTRGSVHRMSMLGSSAVAGVSLADWNDSSSIYSGHEMDSSNA